MKLIIPEHVMLKLKVWRDLGNTEVTGFFITEKSNPLNVIDAILAKATCTAVTVDIDSEAMQQVYFEQSKNGIYPDQMMIWWHTHPGNSSTPSCEDEKTFDDLGKDRTSNFMYILAKNGDETFVVSVKDKTTGLILTKQVAVSHPILPWKNFPDHAELKKQYNENVIIKPLTLYSWQKGKSKLNGKPADSKAPAAHQIQNQTWMNQYPDAREYFDHVEVDYDFDAEEKELFNELDEMVVAGEMTEDEADQEAIMYGWEHGFYTNRKYFPERFFGKDNTDDIAV